VTELPYSPQVLEETPERATRLLQGLGALPIVRTIMAANGMTDEDIEEGRKLLLGCLAEPSATAPPRRHGRGEGKP
jgi:hypothetical protein